MTEVAMTAKHSPGPWTVQVHEASFRVVDGRALKYTNSRLCDVQHWSGAIRGPDRAEAHANASLMSAAPDLLGALKEFSDYVRDEQNSTDGAVSYSNTQINRLVFMARAAITKAEGGAA